MLSRLVGKALLFASLLWAAGASAQTPARPPNIALPNYDRVLIGEYEGLEAGAALARVQGASANWYNPAALSWAKESALNAGVTLYEWTDASLDVLESTRQTTEVNVLVAFGGLVVAPPDLGWQRWSVGLALPRQFLWKSSVDGARQNGTTYSSRSNFTNLTPALAAGYAASESLSIGFSIGLSTYDLTEDLTSADQLISATSASSYLSNFRTDGSIQNLMLSVSTQWSVTERIRFGFVARAPEIRLGGSAGFTANAIEVAGAQATSTFFRDDHARLEFKQPLQLAAGIAYVTPSFELEADLRFHGSAADYALLSSQEPVQTVTTTSGGAPTVQSTSLPDAINDAKALLNGAIGGKLKLSPVLTLHGGFFTSFSPVKDPENFFFRKADLYGVTTGLTFEAARFSGTLGFGYQFGNSEPFGVRSPLSGEATEARLDVDSITGLYSLTVTF